MPKLRNSYLRQIRDILDSTRFTSADFEVELLDSEESETSLVYIKFLADPEYEFEISQIPKGLLRVDCRPGRQYVDESINMESIPNCLNHIAVWCDSIREELGSGDILDRELESMRTELQDQIDEHIKSTSSHFTKDEIASIRESLARMAEELEDLKERADEGEEIIEEMRRDISGLMDDLESYPKYIWLRTAGNKLLNIT